MIALYRNLLPNVSLVNGQDSIKSCQCHIYTCSSNLSKKEKIWNISITFTYGNIKLPTLEGQTVIQVFQVLCSLLEFYMLNLNGLSRVVPNAVLLENKVQSPNTIWTSDLWLPMLVLCQLSSLGHLIWELLHKHDFVFLNQNSDHLHALSKVWI